MLTAKQAKINTDNIQIKWNEDSWKAICSHIEDAISQRNYSIRLMLSSIERDKLLELGYTLTHNGSTHSTQYDIIWK